MHSSYYFQKQNKAMSKAATTLKIRYSYSTVRYYIRTVIAAPAPLLRIDRLHVTIHTQTC